MHKREAPDKVLYDKAFNIAKTKIYDGCQRGLASMLYKFLMRKLLAVLLQMSNQELAEELHKPITKKFEKINVHSSFRQYLGR